MHVHSLEVQATAVEQERARNVQIPSPSFIAATLSIPVVLATESEQQDSASRKQGTKQAEQDSGVHWTHYLRFLKWMMVQR